MHGIPDHVISDNGPQYSSDGFKAFSEEYGFVHITSSSLYPQSNGEAERAVQTAKNILKNNTDPHLGFLAYRTTPLHNGQSPSELLMRRTLRSTLPITQEALKKYPTGNPDELRTREEQYRDKSAQNYNRRHWTIALPPLTSGDTVWIRDQNKFGAIQKRLSSPRSYQTLTETGSSIRRNRQALVHTGTNSNQPVPDQPRCPTPTRPSPTRPAVGDTDGMTTRSCRVIKQPQRLDL